MAYNEHKTTDQVNYGWNLTWEATGKFPIIAKRIWKTLADAQGYVDDPKSTAVEGLVLSVINDPVASNNGVYFVASIGDGTKAGVLVKQGGASEEVMGEISAAIEGLKIESVKEGLAENVREAFVLKDKDGNVKGEQINIYKDSALKSVALNGQKLDFTYILANGSEDTVSVDISTFLAEAEFADGLQVSEGVVNVKLSDDSESVKYLVIDSVTKAVKIQGIDAAIAAAVQASEQAIRADLGHKTDAAATGDGATAFNRIKNLEEVVAQITGTEGEVESVGTQINNAVNALKGDDFSYADLSAMEDDIHTKVAKVDGMGLSSNDYTSAEKSKLSGVAEGATAVSASYQEDTKTLVISIVAAE